MIENPNIPEFQFVLIYMKCSLLKNYIFDQTTKDTIEYDHMIQSKIHKVVKYLVNNEK